MNPKEFPMDSTVTNPIIPRELFLNLSGMFVAEEDDKTLLIYPLNLLKHGASFPHNHAWKKTKENNCIVIFQCTKCKALALWQGEIMEKIILRVD